MGLLGVDTGGTFTDFVWYSPETRELELVKVPSNPAAAQQVFEEGLRLLNRDLSEAERIVQGTTMVTNAIIERDGATVATITSRGYRDLVEIGRQNRFEMYNLKTIRAIPLSARRWRHEVDERTLWDGTVLASPTSDEIERLCKILDKSEVEAVAVCFLFAYVNDANERRTAAQLRDFGKWYVTCSHEIARQSREYERFATTVMNAFVGPRLSRYLVDLQAYFTAHNVNTDHVSWMSASGGSMSWDTSRALPVRLINSGPAGGVQGAVEVARAMGVNDFITYDMGGTSTDVCLVKDLEPTVSSEGYLDRRPMLVPQLDVVTIGAGGGSIAWIDLGGALTVGPQSAGADPGPACYQRGGSEATVTDANVVLGRITHDRPLGATIQISVDLAEKAVAEIAAKIKGLSVVEAAEGIVRIAVAKMTSAIREVSVARGLDPRDFVLFAYGGAGPMHATEVADELGITRVVIPPAPGNFSALGLLMSDARHDLVQSRLVGALDLDTDTYESIFAQLEIEGRRRLNVEGFDDARINTTRSADMRYRGQWFELNVPVPTRPGDMTEIDRLFRAAHLDRFRVDMERPVEFVNFRLAIRGHMDKPAVVFRRPSHKGNTKPSMRAVTMGGKRLSVPVHDRDDLVPGTSISGPAIVDEAGATIVITSNWAGTVHATGALRLERQRA